MPHDDPPRNGSARNAQRSKAKRRQAEQDRVDRGNAGSSGDRSDDLFAEEMAKLGVVPLDRNGPLADQPVRARAGQKPVSRPSTESIVLKQKLADAEEARRALQQELEKRREAWAAEREAWAAEREAWAAEREVWHAERESWRDANQSWNAERSRLTNRHRELQRELAAVKRAAENRVSLRGLLVARGCADQNEVLQVVRGLLETRPDEFLDSIELASRQPVASMLDDRVALVAEGLEVDLGPHCVVVRVGPERCEISGGSDIRAEFRGFLDACRKAGLHRVTIVGGSPSYRKQLRALAEPHKELRIDLIPGNRRRERRRAESEVRASDLVVIWSATELDHSVSEVYARETVPLLRVPHRGISRMLHYVAEELSSRESAGLGPATPTGTTRNTTGAVAAKGARGQQKPKGAKARRGRKNAKKSPR
ncbi:MAG: hypothetical protein MJE77_24415 [Proteobacteria bacterium]|nr:hypothetical protein [Pseudomonadota bacterium]